ncbi:MAG: hypothetical protein ACRER1_00455 [Gammaproteobacteria bacterium]
MSTTAENVREKVQHLADRLPEHATWDDVDYALSVVRDIEEGLKDSAAGRVVDTKTLRAQYGLPE